MPSQSMTIRVLADIAEATKCFDSLTGKISLFAGKIELLKMGFSSIIMPIVGIVTKTAEFQEEVLKMSKSTGISVENLSGLSFAAKISETSLDSLNTGMRAFSKALYGTNEEGDDTTQLLKQLGITANDPYEALMQVSDAFEGMEDGPGKAAIAIDLFGRSGRDLIPFLNEGSDGIKKLQAEAERLGVTFSREAAESADQFNDNLIRIESRLSSLAKMVGNYLIPKLVEFYDLLSGAKDEDIRLGELAEKIRGQENLVKYYGEKDQRRATAQKELDLLTSERDALLNRIREKGLPKSSGLKKAAPHIAGKDKDSGADEWMRTSLELQGDIDKLGTTDSFEKKAFDIFAKFEQLRHKFGDKGLIYDWLFGMLDENDIQAAAKEAEDAFRRLMEESEKAAEFDKGLTEAQASDLDKRLLAIDDWVQKQGIALFQSGADWETYQEKMQVVQQTAEDLKKNILADNTNAIREAQQQLQLANIDNRLQFRGISEPQANAEKLAIYDQRKAELQEQYNILAGQAAKDLERLAVLKKISETDKEILGLQKRQQELTGSFSEGLMEGMSRFNDTVLTSFQEGAALVETLGNSMRTAFSSFLDTTSQKFLDFKALVMDILNSVEKKLAEMLSTNIVGSFKTNDNSGSGILGLFDSLFGGLFHSGGTVGLGSGYYIPRFHAGGLRGDERLTINRVGERYITEEQNAWLNNMAKGMSGSAAPRVSINVNNQTGTQADAQVGNMRFDGEQYIVDVLLKASKSNRKVQTAFGITGAH